MRAVLEVVLNQVRMGGHVWDEEANLGLPISSVKFGSIPEFIIRKLEKNSDITWDRYYDVKG